MGDDKTWAGLPRKTLKLALPTVAALGAGGAIAVAAIPSADGTIHACYQTNTNASGLTGDLRVIDASSECGPNENAISWNQQGPPGPQGPQGAQGQKGDQGNKGDQGDNATTPAPEQTAQAFLKLDGIQGSSPNKAHKGEIDVQSFSWGAFRTDGSNSTGGLGSGKGRFRDFHFTKGHDRSSTKLFKFSATGEHIKTAVFSVERNGKETIRYKLTNVTVETFTSNDSIFNEAENVSLSPLKVEVTFHDGNTLLTSSFDVKTNSKPVINSFSFKTSAR